VNKNLTFSSGDRKILEIMTVKPLLILLLDYPSRGEFLDAILKLFISDFVTNTTKFRSQKIVLKKRPTNWLDGIEYDWTFHHIITKENQNNDDIREFSQDRAERIKFPKFYIDNHQSSLSNYKIWSRTKNNETKYYISDTNYDYLVILSQRKNYIMLLSAFPIETNHYKYKLKKEYEQYK
jgi:hypothetical protein